MNLKQRMEYIRIHTGYTTIHVSTPSHMARPVRLWDTLGYNRIQQNTSARAYPHRLHTIPPDTTYKVESLYQTKEGCRRKVSRDAYTWRELCSPAQGR